MNKTYFYLISILFIFSGKLNAQQTGSFETNITFMNDSRTLSFFVPTAYDDQVPARLVIGLHGLGDSSHNYRDALVNSLNFENTFGNTILICPDAGITLDFHEPLGAEYIIDEAIEYAKQNYNIDTSQIILQGFSFGGRSALRYGLENSSKFKALLLNTPAIQGVKEANAEYANDGLFNFANVGDLPIYITHGEEDELYTAPIDTVVEQLVRNDARVKLHRITNFGHSVPLFSDHPNLLNFYDDPALNKNYDLNLVRVLMPKRSCEPYANGTLLVQNNGTAMIDSISLLLEWNGQSMMKGFGNLNLSSFEHASLPIEDINNLSSGFYDLMVSIIDINDGQSDENWGNNVLSTTFKIELEATNLPFLEDFDSEDYRNDWVENFSGDYILPLEYDEDMKSLYSMNSIFIFENSGTKEEIHSPVLNLKSISNPHLSFEYAFNFVEYTAAVMGINLIFSDTLEIAVSIDCGASFETIYKKSGPDLQTFQNPILNPLSINELFILPEDDDWKIEKLDLSNYAQEENVIVKLSYISGLGGYFELKNVYFGDEQVKIEEIDQPSFRIYPNPVSNVLFIENQEQSAIESIMLLDVQGRVVHTQDLNSKEPIIQISTQDIQAGNYFLLIHTKEQKFTEKIMINK